MSDENASLLPRTLKDSEFKLYQNFFHQRIGLNLPDHKKQLVAGRLGKRLGQLGLDSFQAHYDLIAGKHENGELQIAIDLITTNETSFFREKDHFELLERDILPGFGEKRAVRIWCGASSTGEEPYTLAMVLQHALGSARWSLVATDINSEVLATARRGLYPMARSQTIPASFLKAFCLKGQGEYEGQFLIERSLRSSVDFRQVNLMQLPPDLKGYDVVFLRNVLIYFDVPTKERLLAEVWERMNPGGWLVLSHSESMTGLRVPNYRTIQPSVYRKQGEV